jgi:protein-ribulosamine 3-kinase
MELTARLADLHQRSVSPTGKFGFHMSTCHAKIIQAVGFWEDSWCALYSSHLGHVMDLAKPILKWPEFDVVCELTLGKVVPRLLLPLQSEGRMLKPCLMHGDCWDGNTATDMKTGEAFVFDVCSFYGHNEYDTGNWRAPRHRLSRRAYIQNYKRFFPVSEPGKHINILVEFLSSSQN